MYIEFEFGGFVEESKSPAFQFYPKDFLTDGKVVLMTSEIRGIYITLLCLDWLEDGIPESPGLWFRMAGHNPFDQDGEYKLEFDSIIAQLSACFIKHPTKPGFVTNPRLLRERKLQLERRKERSDAGAKGAKRRWKKGFKTIAEPSQVDSGAIVLPMAKNSSSSASSSPKRIETKDSLEVEKQTSKPEPIVMVFPTVGKAQRYDLTESVFNTLKSGFEHLDVLGECAKALAWCELNPKRRKTAGGMRNFLFSWMARAQNRGSHSQRDFSEPRKPMPVVG